MFRRCQKAVALRPLAPARRLASCERNRRRRRHGRGYSLELPRSGSGRTTRARSAEWAPRAPEAGTWARQRCRAASACRILPPVEKPSCSRQHRNKRPAGCAVLVVVDERIVDKHVRSLEIKAERHFLQAFPAQGLAHGVLTLRLTEKQEKASAPGAGDLPPQSPVVDGELVQTVDAGIGYPGGNAFLGMPGLIQHGGEGGQIAGLEHIAHLVCQIFDLVQRLERPRAVFLGGFFLLGENLP